MHPLVCKIGPLTIYSYGLMLALAFAVSILLLHRQAARKHLDVDKILDLAFWALIWGIIGGRVWYVLFNLGYFLEDPREIIMLHHGGLIWYGGLFFALGFALVYLRRNRLPVLKTLDLLAPYIALGQAIGRIGCFLNGCCFGKPVSWGMYFPSQGERLHPAQLYSFVNLLVIFLILRRRQESSKVDGGVICLYLLLASLERFIVEFFRGDSSPFFLGLTSFQVISLFIIGIAIYANLYLYRRQRRP
jgi:phosphatidylglycerol---prolipoprotein diacylglyceryl transferase